MELPGVLHTPSQIQQCPIAPLGHSLASESIPSSGAFKDDVACQTGSIDLPLWLFVGTQLHNRAPVAAYLNMLSLCIGMFIVLWYCEILPVVTNTCVCVDLLVLGLAVVSLNDKFIRAAFFLT